MISLSHNEKYGTPKAVVQRIENYYIGHKFDLDVCAEPHTAICKNFITKEQNMFKYNITTRYNFMNPPYIKRGWITQKFKKGNEVIKEKIYHEYGIDDFIKFAHDQHFKNNVIFAVLVFSNITSTSYYQEYVGETPQDKIKNHATIFDYPKRIQFELNNKPDGVPAFANKVIVYREP